MPSELITITMFVLAVYYLFFAFVRKEPEASRFIWVAGLLAIWLELAKIVASPDALIINYEAEYDFGKYKAPAVIERTTVDSYYSLGIKFPGYKEERIVK